MGGSFQFAMLNYQRVSHFHILWKIKKCVKPPTRFTMATRVPGVPNVPRSRQVITKIGIIICHSYYILGGASHLLSGMSIPSCKLLKWINPTPTYPTYNQGYNPYSWYNPGHIRGRVGLTSLQQTPLLATFGIGWGRESSCSKGVLFKKQRGKTCFTFIIPKISSQISCWLPHLFNFFHTFGVWNPTILHFHHFADFGPRRCPALFIPLQLFPQTICRRIPWAPQELLYGGPRRSSYIANWRTK